MPYQRLPLPQSTQRPWSSRLSLLHSVKVVYHMRQAPFGSVGSW